MDSPEVCGQMPNGRWSPVTEALWEAEIQKVAPEIEAPTTPRLSTSAPQHLPARLASNLEKENAFCP